MSITGTAEHAHERPPASGASSTQARPSPPGIPRLIGIGLGVALIYIIAARLGFRLAGVAEQVTTVWAPTGLAQAALLLWGRSLWPAIWAGAFIANAGTAAPLWTAASIATGNTLEAVMAAHVLRRPLAFDPAFRRVRDVLAFVIVAAIGSTALSATLGVSTLCAAAVQPWSRFGTLWANWWLGDALGALVVAPVLLTVARTPPERLRRALPEAALLVIGAAVTTQAVFGNALGLKLGNQPVEYLTFPFVIAAAVRLGQPATALVVLTTAIVTIWNTVQGSGPFGGTQIDRSLFLLQAFTGVLAATGLLLAGAMAERELSERRRAAAFSAGEVLADAPDLRNAAPRLLRGIREHLDWPFAALWLVDRADRAIRCLAVSRDPQAVPASFEEITLLTTFEPGRGLPGRVWESGRAAWIENVTGDPNFPRAPAAREAGLAGGFGFPICLGDEVLGVVECFQRTAAAPDLDLLQTMSTVGNQIGQFIGRKRVEEAMAEGQRRTQAILDTALDAIIGMDHLGRITDFNPAAERMFGFAQREALGRELADLLIPPAMRQQHRDGLSRYLATGEGPFIDRRIATSAHHASGREFPVEIAITRVPSEAPPRFTGFVRDLTGQRAAEREREELLQRELAARKEAETASRAKDEFLATLSHELRTPLNAIVGWARMLLDGTVDERSRRRALEVIDRNAQLQVQLIGDILDVSRIIRGGLKLEFQPLDLGTVVAAALDAVRPAADAKGIQIDSRIEAGARFTEGDPQRLQQVVWNLLANAVKFTPQGGRVDIELEPVGSDIRLTVRDTGVGIDPQFLPYVFERFRQADGTVGRQHGGLGLGLAIVRHLIELHGGTVRAESGGPGKGACFIVDLPAGPQRSV